MKQLAIDTSDADEVMIHLLADAAVADGEFSNWDHAYESLWVWLEYELDDYDHAVIIKKHRAAALPSTRLAKRR